MTVIPGMELSTQLGGRSVHLLAYLFDPLDAGILDETARIRESRLHRAEAIVRRIGLDYPIAWADVLAQTTHGTTVGRPHIADALGRTGDRGGPWRRLRRHPASAQQLLPGALRARIRWRR